ncbi:MAG: HlyD family efflux transporter periplasmic adaptor subunit, partial [Pseudomonas sp.]
LGPRAEDVAGAQAQLQVSQAQLALLQHQIDLGTLTAPADAVVRSRLLEPGDMATPQRPVFALALTKPKWVRVYIGEADLGRIKPGISARVLTDSHPDQPIAGKVGYISSVAEFTPKAVQTEELRTNLVYEVRVLVDDGSDVLRLGQPATVYLDGSAAQ